MLQGATRKAEWVSVVMAECTLVYECGRRGPKPPTILNLFRPGGGYLYFYCLLFCFVLVILFMAGESELWGWLRGGVAVKAKSR